MWLWIVLVVLAVMAALLPCVVVDEKGIKRAAVRAKAMARACYPEYEKFNVVKMKVISDE